MMKNILAYLWKLPLCGLAFVFGTVLGGMVAGAVGLPVPELPEGTDAQTLGLYMLLASLVLAFSLTFLARRLSGGWLVRWTVLSLLIWVAYSVNTYLEASIFTTFSAASPYKVVMDLIASLALGAALTGLFRPVPQIAARTAQLPFRAWPVTGLTWRMGAAILAFPAIYLSMGLIVQPYVSAYYTQELLELTAPSWEQILPIALLRSLLFLVACLPVLVTWQGSRRGLVLTLGLALFALTGLVYMTQAYWYPLAFRAIHSAELLADAFIYAWVLVALLYPRAAQSAADLLPVSAQIHA